MNNILQRIARLLICLTLITSAELSSAQDTSYSLPVDPIADLFSSMVQPISENGENKLAMFSYNENALLIYNLKGQDIERKIKYDNQGPKALNNMKVYGGLYYVNKDSIIYYDTQIGRCYISNEQGKIINRFRVDGELYQYGSQRLQKSMAYKDGHLYMQSWPITIGPKKANDYENLPHKIGKVSLKDGSVEEFRFDLPEEYNDKDYSQPLKDLDIIYNPKIDKFIISFPMSHNIYVTDFKGNTKAYSAKSDLVIDAAELKDYEERVGSSMLQTYTDWLSDKYEKLIFDPKSGYYFRIARKGISERAYQERNFSTEKEIIVLDENFNHVKTLKHHGRSFMYYFFMNDEIFWNKDFQKYNLEAGNEDVIYFDRVKFK